MLWSGTLDARFAFVDVLFVWFCYLLFLILGFYSYIYIFAVHWNGLSARDNIIIVGTWNTFCIYLLSVHTNYPWDMCASLNLGMVCVCVVDVDYMSRITHIRVHTRLLCVPPPPPIPRMLTFLTKHSLIEPINRYLFRSLYTTRPSNRLVLRACDSARIFFVFVICWILD